MSDLQSDVVNNHGTLHHPWGLSQTSQLEVPHDSLGKQMPSFQNYT